jgi:hypothetical protein
MSRAHQLIPVTEIEGKITLIRGKRVLLDYELAALYDVPTKSLNLAVKRNRDRFPPDFIFQLTDAEVAGLRFRTETSKPGRGGRRYLPNAFTQEGVAMLSSVLRSQRAVQVNVEIMRAFVRMRNFALTNRELARKVSDLEKRYNGKFEQVFAALRALLAAPEPTHGRKIGFKRFD